MLLAKGAMEAAERLIAKHISTNPSYPFRLVFILNTDGESDDGEQAGNVFQLGYQKWKRDYPQMVEARSFVLGIGMYA